MKRKLIVFITCITLMTPGILPIGPAEQKSLAQEAPSQSNAKQQDQSVPVRRNQSSREQRSYARETHTRRHYHITKGEVLTLATVAAVPMGFGAVAAGGRGLAIGAIVAGPEHGCRSLHLEAFPPFLISHVATGSQSLRGEVHWSNSNLLQFSPCRPSSRVSLSGS